MSDINIILVSSNYYIKNSERVWVAQFLILYCETGCYLWLSRSKDRYMQTIWNLCLWGKEDYMELRQHWENQGGRIIASRIKKVTLSLCDEQRDVKRQQQLNGGNLISHKTEPTDWFSDGSLWLPFTFMINVEIILPWLFDFRFHLTLISFNTFRCDISPCKMVRTLKLRNMNKTHNDINIYDP